MGVTGQEDDVLWMTTHRWQLGSWNIVQRIRASCVCSDAGVVIVNLSVDLIVKLDILQNRAKSDSVEDVRLLQRIQTSTLSVASAFDVENSLISG